MKPIAFAPYKVLSHSSHSTVRFGGDEKKAESGKSKPDEGKELSLPPWDWDETILASPKKEGKADPHSPTVDKIEALNAALDALPKKVFGQDEVSKLIIEKVKKEIYEVKPMPAVLSVYSGGGLMTADILKLLGDPPKVFTVTTQKEGWWSRTMRWLGKQLGLLKRKKAKPSPIPLPDFSKETHGKMIIISDSYPGKGTPTIKAMMDAIDKLGKHKYKGYDFSSIYSAPPSLNPSEVKRLIEKAQTVHVRELQDEFHHLMASPTLERVAQLVKPIEEISDRIARSSAVIGWHPNEAEMMALLWHPRLNDPTQKTHANQLVKSLTSVFRFIKRSLHSTPNEIQFTWGHIGKLSLGGFLPLKYDAMGKENSLLAAYGGQYKEGRETDGLFGAGFIFDGKQHKRAVLDDQTVVELRHGYMHVILLRRVNNSLTS